MSEIGHVESGSIVRECREHGIEALAYGFDLSGLMMTFRANPAHLREAGLGQATPVTTPITTPIDDSNRLLPLLRDNPAVSQATLAKALGLSRDGVKYHLNKLKREGTIRHVGPARGGRWEVLK